MPLRTFSSALQNVINPYIRIGMFDTSRQNLVVMVSEVNIYILLTSVLCLNEDPLRVLIGYSTIVLIVAVKKRLFLRDQRLAVCPEIRWQKERERGGNNNISKQNGCVKQHINLTFWWISSDTFYQHIKVCQMNNIVTTRN